MKFKQLPIIALTSALMAAPSLALADDDELEFDEAYLFFELNDTDGDLGIHGKVDGGPWKWVAIEGPNERRVMYVLTRGSVRRQGLTELFFESAEPTFDELDPEVFFARFPEGEYEWEGKTLDWKEIEGETYLSHVIPAAPVVAEVGGKTDNPGFDEEGDKECWEDVRITRRGVLIDWDPVTESHFDKWSNPANEPLENEEKIPLGASGELEDLAYYEFVAEIDDTEFKSTALIPPNITQWTIPASFIRLARSITVEDEDSGEQVPVEEIKFEIIVRVETGDQEDNEGEEIESTLGNQSAVEDCFEI